MSIVLATAWKPRGELARFRDLLPKLLEIYQEVAIALPPDVDQAFMAQLKKLEGVHFTVTPDWSWGRYACLEKALETTAEHIQYADFDRILRWIETRPDELRLVVQAIQASSVLIIGRTAKAYATHPQALLQTERISNLVTSYLLGKEMDVSAGSKGFNREAVEQIIAHTSPGHALGTDGEWPVLLQRAGFRVEYIEVDGLDWESADRYLDQAADLYRQRQAAEAYDADPKHWAFRVDVANEIVASGLDADRKSKSINEESRGRDFKSPASS